MSPFVRKEDWQIVGKGYPCSGVAHVMIALNVKRAAECKVAIRSNSDVPKPSIRDSKGCLLEVAWAGLPAIVTNRIAPKMGIQSDGACDQNRLNSGSRARTRAAMMCEVVVREIVVREIDIRGAVNYQLRS